eukprot:Clim_evm29s25 gene=Clim_evmTU29s25
MSSEYEQQRALQIQANRAVLESLGITDQRHKITAESIAGKRRKTPGVPKRRMQMRQLRIRQSRRIRGESAEVGQISDPEEIIEEPLRVSTVTEYEVQHPVVMKRFKWEGYRQMPYTPVTDYIPKKIHLPLTLLSVGTTVRSLGQLVAKSRRKLFYSNRICRYRHQYPIGYTADRYFQGHCYRMTIEDAGDGPLFAVTRMGSERRWTGVNPTDPWTGACLASRSPGTRVSGPLYFGFSDPIVIKAIEDMNDGYDSSQEEDTD